MLRPATIVVGFLAANFAASMVLCFLFSFLFSAADVVNGQSSAAVGGLLSKMIGTSILTLFFSLLPASIAITAAENNGNRALKFYVLSGGATSLFPFLIMFLFAFVMSLGSPARSESAQALDGIAFALLTLSIFVAAGMVGGAVYWAIAGRTVCPTAPDDTLTQA